MGKLRLHVVCKGLRFLCCFLLVATPTFGLFTKLYSLCTFIQSTPLNKAQRPPLQMKKCKVPFTILDQTKQCNYDFSCLGTGKYNGPEGCEVDYLYGDNVLFLKSSKHSHSCPYRAHFNNRQMCLCPTKFNCYFQREDEEAMFKECKTCEKVWRNYHEFLSDAYTSLVGYQVNFEALEAGFFLFNHSCHNTLAIPVEAFTHLYDGPIFRERATGTDKCPGYCLDKCQLQPCPAECECAYVREVLQIVKKWPKAY